MGPNRRRRNAEVEDRVATDVRQEELWQMNVAVPVELHREMRLRAADEDITLETGPKGPGWGERFRQ